MLDLSEVSDRDEVSIDAGPRKTAALDDSL